MSPPSTTTSLRRLFLIWLKLGAQSFGGGVATFALIREAAVDRFKWVTAEEFLRDNSLSHITPGMNILALTALLGKRVAGFPGVVVSLTGLILPSAGITILITAFYSRIQGVALVANALKGVLPATLGLGFLMVCEMAYDALKVSRKASAGSLWLTAMILIVSGVAVAFLKAPVFIVLVCGGCTGAAWHWRQAVLQEREPQS